MKVYLTGVDAKKTPKRNYHEAETQKVNKIQKNYQEETDEIREESISKELNDDEDTFPHDSKYKIKTKNINRKDEIKKTNNFITFEDITDNKNNNKYHSSKEFEKLRKSQIENQRNKEKIKGQLKEDFFDFIMLKEPKYADFGQISLDLRKQIFENYKKYNKNLLEIETKKKLYKDILIQIEKTLINNYYVIDTTLIPKKVESIEKTKIEILTKEQEYAGYKRIHEDLYNQKNLIKRKMLDEIEYDRANEEFHDQYKLLEIHAIVQVSKKQESLNQTEEYYKKLLIENEKEFNAKNKLLKELKIEIEVFKEDEKDLIHKLKKLKSKRNDIKKLIKERQKKNLTYHENLIKNSKKYQKSFISMNKIFKSVNANNLNDVLLDVNSINGRFNHLKILITKSNQDITDLNSLYSKLIKEFESIQKQIRINKNKKTVLLNERDKDKLIRIKQLFKKEKEEQNEIRKEIQKQIGVFQNGIVFIFHKIKSFVLNIKTLKNFVHPKIFQLIHKYKHQPYRLNYDQINRKFFKQFSFLFFSYCNIVFYLTLTMMCSGMQIQGNNNGNELIKIQVDNKQYLNIYGEKIKKELKDYKHRLELKKVKQKEMNEKSKQKEIQEKIVNQIMNENKNLNHKQMYKKFIEYLRAKEKKEDSSKNKRDSGTTKIKNSKKNSFFFTGIDSMKSNPLDSSSTSSSNSFEGDTSGQIGFKKKKEPENLISYQQKEDYFKVNKNKLMNMFSKYQNNLVKEEGNNIYTKKTIKGGLKKTNTYISPKMVNYKYNKQSFNPYFSFQKKTRNRKEERNTKNKKVHSLFDTNYEYDEEEEDLTKHKESEDFNNKKETKNYFALLKINKDRANLYKKKNDLQRLQFSYFGGRFLNTKINQDSKSAENNFNDLVGKMAQKQEHGKHKSTKKIRLNNYKKKSVFYISANQSMKNKVSLPWKKDFNNITNKDIYFSNNDRKNKKHNYTYIRAKYFDYKRNSLKKSKTQKFEVFTPPPFSKTFNRFSVFSPSNLYRNGIE